MGISREGHDFDHGGGIDGGCLKHVRKQLVDRFEEHWMNKVWHHTTWEINTRSFERMKEMLTRIKDAGRILVRPSEDVG